METSDDPATMAIVGPIVVGAVVGEGVKAASGQTSLFGKKGGGSQRTIVSPAVQKEQAKATAEPTERLSEAQKRNRRLQANALTRQFSEPLLGKPGLTGT